MNKTSRLLNIIYSDPWILLQKFLSLTSPFWSDKMFVKLNYLRYLHKWPNIDNPVTFSEKLQWLKIYDKKPLYTKLVDKYSVKEFVARTIGQQFIIPTINVYETLDEININDLPQKFVIKTTHGGGASGVVICNDKDSFDWEWAKSKLNKAFQQDQYRTFREWPYKNVKKRFIAEEYIEQEGGLKDYKFYCFNGVPKYCQVIANRTENETIDFFDDKWVHQPFVGLHLPPLPNAAIQPEKPECYDEMLDIAAKLSMDIPFVRVDLYQIDGHPYFGELTFYPYAGFGSFFPKEWNRRLGESINLPNMHK